MISSLSYELLATFGGLQGITIADKNAWEKVIHDFSPRAYQNIIAKITGALEEQTVIIPGTQAGEHVIAFTTLTDTCHQEQKSRIREAVRDSDEMITP